MNAFKDCSGKEVSVGDTVKGGYPNENIGYAEVIELIYDDSLKPFKVKLQDGADAYMNPEWTIKVEKEQLAKDNAIKKFLKENGFNVRLSGGENNSQTIVEVHGTVNLDILFSRLSQICL